MIRTVYILLLLVFVLQTSCVKKTRYTSPQGYDLTRPVKHRMPESLLEISGIAFNNGNTDTVYAQEDEDGKIYYLKLTDKVARHSKFAKHGDYEDISIINNQAVILKSNGTLYTFPLSDVKNDQAEHVKEWKKILPKAEYEGMYADSKASKLYILCKTCDGEKKGEASPGYILDITPDSVFLSGSFNVGTKAIAKALGEKKINLRTSALAKSPVTGQWYIVSSINRALVIADAGWNVKQVHKLDPKIFIQPEGIAFDKQGNLYISNEGDEFNKGNILYFKRNN
jgi:uncharacterized protein YjiK